MVVKTRLSPHVFLLFAATASLWAPHAAAAEPSPSERAIAQRLFDQAKEKLRANQVGAACESFAESQRLDPATGTLLNLAACHEREGKLASAWVEFRECSSALRGEGRSDRLRFALDHVSAIEPKLAYLTLLVRNPSPGPDPIVRLDGHDLGPAAWGIPIPVDEGEHEVRAQREDGRLWRATVAIRNGERKAVSVRTDVGSPAVAPNQRAGERPSVGLSRTRTVAAVVMGSLGLAALGVATYEAFHAETLWRERNEACRNDVCSPVGLRLGDRAETSAEIATWSLAGGVAACGTAAVLWLWPGDTAHEVHDHPARQVAVTLLPGEWRLQLGGAF